VDWSKFKQFGRQRIFRLLALLLIPIIAIASILCPRPKLCSDHLNGVDSDRLDFRANPELLRE
jgi:hypothetical protein